LERWQVSARNFDLQKAYDWMASLLAPSQPNRILDIGCGSGEGLAAVHRRFPNSRILSCDENLDALSAAQERLKNIGAHVSVIPRISVVAINDRSHELKFQPGKLKMGHGITLIESDILIDDDLLSFLAVQKEFDAITIWLIGSHRLRYDECTNLASFNIQSPESYRHAVQWTAFAMAGRVLRRGGIIQTVDRIRMCGPVDQLKEYWLGLHAEHARVCDGQFEHKEIDFFTYDESNNAKALSLVDGGGQRTKARDLALVSVTSVKVR
jgi:SAM-dependent methyltransferase